MTGYLSSLLVGLWTADNDMRLNSWTHSNPRKSLVAPIRRP